MVIGQAIYINIGTAGHGHKSNRNIGTAGQGHKSNINRVSEVRSEGE